MSTYTLEESWGKFKRPKYPEKAAAEVMRLCREAEDGLSPGAVVDAARPKRSPLHPCFEWDDSIAAEKFRKDQARSLVIAVVEVSEDEHTKERTVEPVISYNGRSGYVEIYALPDKPDDLEAALAQLQSHVDGTALTISRIVSIAEDRGLGDLANRAIGAIAALKKVRLVK